ncbi:hypothetical protein GOODEAATRI_021498 [Goodea atripinnis]|uniref:Cell division cycle 20B n=1 Tax=Goodea atripinnis TaxID=208336 RepID=A0ABV0P6R1_9TELE
MRCHHSTGPAVGGGRSSACRRTSSAQWNFPIRPKLGVGSRLHWADRMFCDGKVFLTLEHNNTWTAHVPEAAVLKKQWDQETEHSKRERSRLQRGCILLTKELKLSEEQSDLNLLDWSSRNILAVALNNNVYLWDAAQGDIHLLMKMEREEDYISSLSWTKEGNYLAVGTSDCKVQVSVTMYVWLLADVLDEVCGLKWSPDGRYLASGGNDNLALAWCPWQSNILASGGGTSDRHIRTWNVNTGSCISSLDTQSQVMALFLSLGVSMCFFLKCAFPKFTTCVLNCRSHRFCLHPTIKNWSLHMGMPTTMLSFGSIPLLPRLQNLMLILI